MNQKKLHNENFQEIVDITAWWPRQMSWVGHVGRNGTVVHIYRPYKFIAWNSEERDLGFWMCSLAKTVHGRQYNSKLILGKDTVREWRRLIWLRARNGDGLLWILQWTYAFKFPDCCIIHSYLGLYMSKISSEVSTWQNGPFSCKKDNRRYLLRIIQDLQRNRVCIPLRNTLFQSRYYANNCGQF